MLIKRKSFLQVGSLATASLMMPRFLKAMEKPTAVPPGNKVLVVLQFSGGNDGLNTVVPISNDIYYKSRPKLAIAKDKAHRLTDDAGVNPNLPIIKTLFDAGDMAILNSVGYPNPDRSHFRSMDIWHTASDSNQYLSHGWIGKYLDAQCAGCDKPTNALEVDDVLSLALKGETNKAIAFKDPIRLYQTSKEKMYNDLNTSHKESDESVDYLYKTLAETLSSAKYIFNQSKLNPSKYTYPATELGRDMKTVASLIFSDINTKVYYLSVGSFDTHVNQDGQQGRLFKQINDALQAFVADLKQNNRFDDVLLMTFSEFGRRVAQNASNGTDHGTANNMFLIGCGLKQKGLINAMPDLQNLKDGDLQYQVDFKNVYATVLNKWLGADDKKILGKQYDFLNFL